MLRLILSGCMGKMGHAIMNAVAANPDFTIVAGVDKMAHLAEGYPFPVYAEIGKCTEKADVVMDFSRPDALPTLLRYGQQNRMAMVLASTGYNKNDISSVAFASETIPILCCSNMSVGINLLKNLSTTAASILNNTFDVEIIEKHHNTKADAPSGTAMMLADAINEASGGDLDYIYDRHERREARPKRELGIHAIRGGTITGDHTVLFAGPDEVIELTHRAYSRNIYAMGALQAAAFISKLPCGLYDMSSMLTQQRIITSVYTSESDAILTVSKIRDPKLIADVFTALKESEIMVDIISQPLPVNQVYTLSLSVSKIMAEKALRVISDLTDGETVELLDDVAKVTVEGSGMAHHAGAAGDVIGTLAKAGIPVLLITTSETKITCCVPSVYAAKAMAELKSIESLNN